MSKASGQTQQQTKANRNGFLKGRVLVVDDSPINLELMTMILEQSAFEVHACKDALHARQTLEDKSISFFDCLLTDYSMPVETGLDLVHWLKTQDETLAAIIVTGQGESAIIQDSLREGVVDFIDKPFKAQTLCNAVEKGIATTRYRRKIRETEKGLQQASGITYLLHDTQAPEFAPYLRTLYLPRHEIGGDFLNVFKTAANTYALIIGDVSGHSVKSGIISAYFQGILHGLMEKGTSIQEIFHCFEDHLGKMFAQERNSRFQVPVSMAACSIELDFENQRTRILNCGLPYPSFTTHDGKILEPEDANFPFGWFEMKDYKEETVNHDEIAILLMCTDGLKDHARYLGIDPAALAFRLLQTQSRENVMELIGAASDDIVILRCQYVQDTPIDTLTHPALNKTYTGDEVDNIDKFEKYWRQTFTFLLDGQMPDRLDDLVLCCREAMLNAFNHGCKGDPHKSCTIQATFIPASGRLRIRVVDPGQGHGLRQFDNYDFFSEDTSHISLGLTIISKLADKLEFANSGSVTIFDFYISSKKFTRHEENILS